ncbi:DNA-binding transcriptional regulator, Lrp family [Arthrobacter sp. 9V]|uniref:Lrp/AsnC family transcriptional regulator n=1 Tax=Arthrobacter sp. 9V TaxID=2653132 RepID=UPI0012EF986E|nr:Lrp/AsnC family transcriptional regulator [Arthrobacter sp. 9V]VXB51176.1 DNA-binding transcriptional regulator, Lrp family [Arthrobacter sp. 9V]
MTTADSKTLQIFDGTDKAVFKALDDDPRIPILFLAKKLGLARGTVQTRLERKMTGGSLFPHSTRIAPEALGLPISALVTAEVEQSSLDAAVQALGSIPEVIEVQGMAGEADLAIRVVARDMEDLFRLGQAITECAGIRRSTTSLLLKRLIPLRIHQLLDHA